MFTSQTKTNGRVWLRVFIPAIIVLLWLAGAAFGGPLFGKVSEVSSNDPTDYLPSSADATQVQTMLADFNGGDEIPAIAVFVSETTLSESDIASIEDAVTTIKEIPGVGAETSPAIISEDGLAAQLFIPISSDAPLDDTVTEISNALNESVPESVKVYLTGPAGFSADLVSAFAGIDGLLLGVALLAVFIILILVYRSLLLPVVVLSTSMFALCVALLVVFYLAKAGILLLSGQTQGILFILVIGAATDYSLLFVARFREQLRLEANTQKALLAAWKGSVEPILASGATVIAGLLCLLLSDLKSNSALGPVASVGIIFAMLSALTLLPALLMLFGRKVYWPRVPKFDQDARAHIEEMPTKGVWAKLARFISKRARIIWVVTTLVLVAGALAVPLLKADGVAQSELVLGTSQAREGQAALGEHFPGGSGSPVYVLVSEDQLPDAVSILLQNDGVSAASVSVQDSPSGTAAITSEGITAFGPPGTPTPELKIVDGKALLQGTLNNAADSDAAAETVAELQTELANLDVMIGGVTATALATNQASIHDRNLIIPLVLVVITLILMLLLRSILAPVLLVLTTVLSFGTALGVSALIFNGIFDFPGADPAVPLYGFVFLVALGIDYNIFLMTRVREESLKYGTRRGVLRGLIITGGVITSAGLVLAATFAALSVIPILFLVQLAFIVAFGVLLDTFVVRTLLVPALVYDIGNKVWWPSRLSRQKEQDSIEA